MKTLAAWKRTPAGGSFFSERELEGGGCETGRGSEDGEFPCDSAVSRGGV